MYLTIIRMLFSPLVEDGASLLLTVEFRLPVKLGIFLMTISRSTVELSLQEGGVRPYVLMVQISFIIHA